MRRIKSKWQLRKKKRKIISIDKLSSKSEAQFLTRIEEIYGIKVHRQFALDYRYYDARYKNILLEIDGERWHSRKKQIWRDRRKDKIALKYGFILYRIKLNNLREVESVLEKNKDLLNTIFKKNGKIDIQVPAPERS